MKPEQSNLPPISCIKSTEYSIHTRRCFMTGEYCAQQTNIQKERQKLHDKGEINAFVVMNFSSVSDVVYEARIKPFIKDLKEYLYLCKEEKLIACVSDPKSQKFSNSGWKKVESIHVHRADSNPVSNYIICNRICQQMQMADLIIVDVSVESANVFYEFGLATAFQKLILPICFSDSFYVKKLPEKLAQLLQEDETNIAKTQRPDENGKYPPSRFKFLEDHIDCFPWRRKLFEHFGIRYHRKDDEAKYESFYNVTSEGYGFSDIHYDRFPYATRRDGDNHDVGWKIYRWLQLGFTPEDNPDDRPHYNTVVCYTMDDFLDKSQAGLCIINFYNNITKPMHDNYCFCGDRVVILGRPNKIWDNPKDNQTGSSLNYSVSDLIRIGMDQATYLAERKRIKTSDYLLSPAPKANKLTSISKADKEEAKKQVKSYIRNRSIPLSPDNPVYVTQYKEGIQKNLDQVFQKIKDSNKEDSPRFFCLYHIMLDTLRYSNEIVVDLSSNSIQAMFWLGAAHGSDVYAVTVRHETTEQEKSWSGKDTIAHDRPIFDIGGLWTAMLHYGEMDSFYKQLELIQQGIDQHARLKLPETELKPYEYQVFRQLYHASPFLKYGTSRLLPGDLLSHHSEYLPYKTSPPKKKTNTILRNINDNERINAIHSELAGKSRTESLALESYYRDRFWRQLLRDNQLHLFLPLNDTNDTHGPRLQIIKWDMDTVAELSHYLSKRKVIGRYQFDTLRENEYYGQNNKYIKRDTAKENFIAIGANTKPFAPLCTDKDMHDNITYEPLSLGEWLEKKYHQDVWKMGKWFLEDSTHPPVSYRGFLSKSSGNWGTQYLDHECIQCKECAADGHCKKRASTVKTLNNCKTVSIMQDRWNALLKNLPEKLTLVKDHTKSSYRFISNDHGHFAPSFPIGSFFYFEYDSKGDLLMHPCAKELLGSQGNPHDAKEQKMARLFSKLPRILNLKRINTHSNSYKVLLSTTNSNMNHTISILSSLVLACDDTKCFVPKVKGKICGYSPINNPEVEYSLPAQLLLWRDEQGPETENRMEYKFHVSLIGVSGPATKALTALLVDDEQKWDIWGDNPGNLNDDLQNHLSRYLPLNTLQMYIRKEFFNQLGKNISKEAKQTCSEKCNSCSKSTCNINFSSQRNDCIKKQQKSCLFACKKECKTNLQQIFHLSTTFLSTILPQYFLPFLSQSDEKRIFNALEAFLRITDSQNTDIFEPAVRQHTDTILNALEKTLSEFRGVDALYKVEVSAIPGDKDNRKIQKINLLKDDKRNPVLNCLFISN